MSSEPLCSVVQQKYFFYVVKNFYECKGTKIINIKASSVDNFEKNLLNYK